LLRSFFKAASTTGAELMKAINGAWIACTVLSSAAAIAQDYPTRPIRIVTSVPGSGNDLVSRLVAPGLTATFGQQIVVDNRGISAMDIVAKAQPDGYTLLVFGSPLWVTPLMRETSWKPLVDFVPITVATSSPNILVVHPTVPVTSVKDLVAMAKAKPGELNYASAGAGSTAHIAGELFKSMAGVNIVHVPYKGTGFALTDLLGGQVQIMFSTAAAATSHVKSGKLRALAVTSAEPSALAPGLPTVASSGLPGYTAASLVGFLAPMGTPATLIDRLNRAVVAVLEKRDVKDKLFASGAEIVGGSPRQFTDTMKAEMSRLGKVIKAAGIRE
jgi:tripartite-type tricarboxylate transporter receptor subunit TctC